MKKLYLTALVALCSAAFVPTAFAAEPAAKATAKKAEAKKKAPIRKRAPAKKKAAVAAAPKAQPVDGSELWSCTENHKLYIKGNMKRDQVLTMFWDGRNYKLPRQQTTTGADRFYDAASGLDLIVIPAKAMLFTHRDGGSRLADECLTQAMAEHDKLAPTQSVELIKVTN